MFFFKNHKQVKRVLYRLSVVILLFIPACILAQPNQVLMFVSYEDTYYSEYIVMRKALEAAGYSVDVRSAGPDSASTYMLPANTDIAATAATLPGGSYLQFTQQFQQLFGATWNASWDPTPAYIPVNGRIQDIINMNSYAALVIAGGTGASDYRVDGVYNPQGTGSRTLSAATIQAASLKLNALAIEALQNSKPVLAQCHGASLPAFWRIPGTSGPGIDSIGYSLLRNNQAAGFPDVATGTTLSSLTVTYKPDDRVCISSPHTSLVMHDNGKSKIITTRDWFPQTVASAAKSLLMMLQSYPSKTEMQTPVNVLILHGGIVDSLNCSASNRANDIPCNYGGGINTPADYRHIQDLLNADSPNDSFLFVTSHLNINNTTLPYNANNTQSILSYLSGFKVVIFFKHWSDNVNSNLQNALVEYADNGGGVLGLHHGMYNDYINATFNKDILYDQMFGVQSFSGTWSGGNLSNYNLFLTNYGHFISTYGLTLTAPLQSPSGWLSTPQPATSNNTYSYSQRIPIYDETYNNMLFKPGIVFGNAVNQTTPLFSNDASPSSQNHTSGFVKLYNPSLNASQGKVVYLEAGERRESISITHAYGQVIRNAIVWLADQTANAIPVSLTRFVVTCSENDYSAFEWQTASEKNNAYFEIETSNDLNNWISLARVKGAGNSSATQHYRYTNPAADVRYFRLKQTDYDGNTSFSDVVNNPCLKTFTTTIFPNPAEGSLNINFDQPVANVTIAIYSLQGNLIRSQKTENTSGKSINIDISQLESGMYIIGIESENRVERKLIIKN